jgi:GT2 family glycosyltransferase
VIELGDNFGFAKAMNVGIEAAASEYVAFLNNDTPIALDWPAELVACLDDVQKLPRRDRCKT